MTFEQENDALLEDILEENFYRGFKDITKAKYANNSLELNITATCNQKCEYCYLTKFGDQIYPPEIRNEDQIVENTKMLIDYFLEKGYHPGTLDIFSGEIWGTKLANRVFEAILDGINRGWGITFIMIPSNMSFILSPTKLKNIENWIDKFEKVNCRLTFSASVDGLYIEAEERSFKNEKLNANRSYENFYSKLFEWCKKYKFAFHPMVAANSIEKWIDNITWWEKMFAKYKLDPFEYGMYLEVRNDEWTLEKIDSYLDYLNYFIEYDFRELLGSDIRSWVKEAICTEPNPKKGYFPYVLLNSGDTFNCTINTSLIVRLGDLAIGPCHRTHYDKFLYGKYRVEDGKITGVKANNIQLANLVLNQSSKGIMKCEKCPISHNCMRGCLGAQYESTGEILQPCESVCQFMKARIIFLYLKYKKMGVFDFVEQSGDANKKSFLNMVEKEVLNLKEGEPNLWNYWEMKTMQKLS